MALEYQGFYPDITEFGDQKELLIKKPFFREDIEKGELGCPALKYLENIIRASYWFSAHLHVKFTALHQHDDNRQTQYSEGYSASWLLTNVSRTGTTSNSLSCKARRKSMPRLRFGWSMTSTGWQCSSSPKMSCCRVLDYTTSRTNTSSPRVKRDFRSCPKGSRKQDNKSSTSWGISWSSLLNSSGRRCCRAPETTRSLTWSSSTTRPKESSVSLDQTSRSTRGSSSTTIVCIGSLRKTEACCQVCRQRPPVQRVNVRVVRCGSSTSTLASTPSVLGDRAVVMMCMVCYQPLLLTSALPSR